MITLRHLLCLFFARMLHRDVVEKRKRDNNHVEKFCAIVPEFAENTSEITL
jgi:hypothetical protein